MAAVFQGGEGKTGRVGIYADEGDDNDDKWMFEATTGAQFVLRSYQPGSWQTSFLVDQANTKFHIFENLDLSSGDFDVSGSATSTGSFGQVKAGKVSVLDESRFDITYLPDLQFYEEGVYTATLTPQGSGTITLNSSWNKLGFTRIGNKVHVHGNLIVSSVSSPVGTNVALNLPYQTRANNSSTNGTMRQTGTLVYYNTSNWYSMPMMIDENDTVVLMLFDSYRTLGGDAPPNVNTIAGSWQFRIDFHYFIGRFD